MNRSPLVRSLLASAAILTTIVLAGCQVDGTLPAGGSKAMAPLSARMVSDIETKNMDKDSPILVRTFKQEAELEVWKQDRAGRFELLKTYPICRWSGELGPKVREGDRQAPEGFYTITPAQMNPNSQYYLSFDLGYPNAFDRSLGRTGSNLMVHGDCSSRGCYSMTDEQIAEIYALGREAFFGGQRSFQVQAYPFKMTPANFAKHRNNPNIAFWKMLKEGSDHFELTHLEPKVNVCEKRYVFDAQNPNDPSKPLAFSASGKCPVFEVPDDIVAGLKDKQRQDDVQIAQLSRSVVAAPVLTHADGGMNPVFAEAVKRNQIGMPPSSYALASVPGTIPAHVNPPKTAEFEGTPVVAASAPAPAATQTWARMAVADTSADAPVQTAAAGSNSNFFGGLFASKSSTDKPAAKKDDSGPLDRMAKLIGLRGSKEEAAPKPPEPLPAAKPKAVAAAHPTSNGAIRPKEPKPVETVQQQAEPATPSPAPAARVAEQTPARSAPSAGTLQGSAAIVPTGSFENRWSGFR